MKTVKSAVIKKPLFTEKASLLGKENTYTFEVERNAVKADIVGAIKERYGVTPVDVRVINIANRNIGNRGKKKTLRGYKKAMVVLKKGDTIDFTV